MILCLVVEAIVILTLVVIIGWNKGVGDWMESLQRPVVRKLEMSGINSPYAVLMQVKGGKQDVMRWEKYLQNLQILQL